MVAIHDEEIKQAPSLEPGTELLTADEERLFRYHKMEHQQHGSGHRLVRRRPPFARRLNC